ncbi:MAG TPA: glycosyltransferase family 39 protein [Pyrinomonadaceae bacterium]|nr:glycosyltransferase family 39 protein [Pyrinomonadaceae bacterium]
MGEGSFGSTTGRAARVAFATGGDAARPFGGRALIGFACALALYAFARLWHLSSASLDTDEVFALLAVRRGWPDFLDPVAAAAHPPLFYVLLKAWVALGGESRLWLRLLPALASVSSVVPFALLCRRLNVRPAAANVALALLAVNSFLVAQAQRARMYGLLELFALASLWLFVKFVNEDDARARNLLALTVVNVLLVYTHYFGGLLVGVELLFLLAWARGRVAAFAVSLAALAACLAPWAVWAARASVERAAWREDVGWVVRPSLSNLVLHYATLNGLFRFRWNVWLGAFVFVAPLALLAWRVFRADAHDGRARGDRSGTSERAALALLVLAAFAPALVVFAASRALPFSFWITRYVIFTAAPYLLLVAVAASRLRPRALRAAALAAMLVWAGASGVSYLSASERRVSWEELARRVRQAEQSSEGGVRIYAVGYNTSAPLAFHLGEARDARFDVVRVRRADLASVEGRHFWVAYRPVAGVGATPRDTLAARGFRLGEEISSAGVAEEVRLLPVWREEE